MHKLDRAKLNICTILIGLRMKKLGVPQGSVLEPDLYSYYIPCRNLHLSITPDISESKSSLSMILYIYLVMVNNNQQGSLTIWGGWLSVAYHFQHNVQSGTVQYRMYNSSVLPRPPETSPLLYFFLSFNPWVWREFEIDNRNYNNNNNHHEVTDM